MRPRVFPAEDVPAGHERRPSGSGFNEAAGIPRGRQVLQPVMHRRRKASMRPRVFPAEDEFWPASLVGRNQLQ